jgi:hypothetical protein
MLARARRAQKALYSKSAERQALPVCSSHMEGRFLTADILTLDDFRRGDGGPARNPRSEREGQSHTLWLTLPDPLPKDWSQFWKANDFWFRRQALATGPSPESWRQALVSLRSKVSPLAP